MYSYVMLCAMRDALERDITYRRQQGASASDLNAAIIALALTRAQILNYLAENGGRVGSVMVDEQSPWNIHTR